MSHFKIPEGICRKLNGLLAKFIWGRKSDENMIIWNPNALWCRLLKQFYFPRTDFLDASLGPNPYWAWRSLILGRNLLMKGIDLVGWQL
uniref:Uncharacterized protein n=1 Tax=Nelumbo nucifera TaxID=4432 RepID=A0A822ZUM3_NELNU|nr:TPA_asm: hypothetical protein HUJ06_018879 [Nelumbo nucifera]